MSWQSPIQYVIPRAVASNVDGYELLANISIRTFDTYNSYIILDFSNNEWFDVNLCASFGALIDDLRRRNNKVNLIQIGTFAEDIFKKNGFHKFCNPGYQEEIIPVNVEFRRFDLSSTTLFQNYISAQLLGHDNFPKMSELLKKKINKSILELYNNAHTHGKCQHIYTCGEYFEKNQILKFTIADMGVTIRKNVNDFFKSGSSLDGDKTIEWAVQKGNTTKSGDIPGGLGLSLIRAFIKLNEGAIQIISSNGLWEEKKGLTSSTNLKSRFLGTIITMEFNLSDTKLYILNSEVNSRNVL